ncbi:hypothetical protein V6N13_081221 [Hibiscus sabdariffa]|uniref:Uncharacterized protein n=1 Tax=Hibiscus sabdariffa TaxID=183260 RepID=A0ABR2P9C5_9ROSI
MEGLITTKSGIMSSRDVGLFDTPMHASKNPIGLTRGSKDKNHSFESFKVEFGSSLQPSGTLMTNGTVEVSFKSSPWLRASSTWKRSSDEHHAGCRKHKMKLAQSGANMKKPMTLDLQYQLCIMVRDLSHKHRNNRYQSYGRIDNRKIKDHV